MQSTIQGKKSSEKILNICVRQWNGKVGKSHVILDEPRAVDTKSKCRSRAVDTPPGISSV